MDDRESRGSFATYAAAPNKTSSYGSDFLRLTKTIGNNIQKIQSNVQQMKKLMTDLATKPDNKVKQSLHDIQHKTNALVKDTSRYIQDLNQIQKSSNMPEQKRHKLQRERLVSQFSKTLDHFQEVQKQEKEKAKDQVVRDRQSVKRWKQSLIVSTPDEKSAVLRDNEQMVIIAEITDVDLELMKEREEELQKLEADITDVNQIFRDLNVMIHEQGEVLDIIENNVESTAVCVEEGTKELQKAYENQTSTRKKKLIIIVVVVVVIAIILIIILASVLSNKQ